MIVLRGVYEPGITAAAAGIVRYEFVATAAGEHQICIEIIGLQIHSERLIWLDRQDPALEVGGVAGELGIVRGEIARHWLPNLYRPRHLAESAAHRVGR